MLSGGGVVEAVACEHRAVLLRTALSVTRNLDDAEDAVQDALLIGLRKNGHLNPATADRYLTVVARHEALRVLRQRRDVVDDPDLVQWIADRACVDDEEADEEADRDPAVLRAALATLKPDQRVALREFYSARQVGRGHGVYHAIGRRHGWSYTKVSRLLSEGRAALREAVARPLVVTVYVDRERYPSERQAIVAAMQQQRGRVRAVAMRKLIDGKERAPQGRRRLDGRLGQPVWRIDVEASR